MSYSTDPVLDASRHYDALYARQEAEDRARAGMESDFLAACRQADANALSGWAPHVTDWKGQPYLVGNTQMRPKRAQTLSEVMADSLDYGDGPSSCELHQLLLNAAAGADVQAAAADLLMRMADKFAEMNAQEAA